MSSKPKYLTVKTSGGYKYYMIQRVSKKYNVHIYIGKDYDKALKILEKLNENNWTPEIIQEIKQSKPERGWKYGKYIHKQGNKYILHKQVNKELIHFGIYNTLQEAQKARDYYENRGWKRETPVRKHDPQKRYIYQRDKDKKYYISKNVNGRREYFGVYNTFQEAEEERKLLEECNWDYNTLLELY